MLLKPTQRDELLIRLDERTSALCRETEQHHIEITTRLDTLNNQVAKNTAFRYRSEGRNKESEASTLRTTKAVGKWVGVITLVLYIAFSVGKMLGWGF